VAILAETERILTHPGESRSAMLSRVLAATVERGLDERYADGYRRHPVTPDEDVALEGVAREGFADVQADEKSRGRTWQRRIPVEVEVGPANGLEHASVINVDELQTIRISHLVERIGQLDANQRARLDSALRFR
jgi:hypothetical protein